jgi:hypothetical protein
MGDRKADVSVAESEFHTFTTDVTRLSDAYNFFGENRFAKFGVFQTAEGFTSSVTLYRKVEGGGYEPIGPGRTLTSPTLEKAIVDMRSLRRWAGVPDSDRGTIQTPVERANKTKDPFTSTKREEPTEPTPVERAQSVPTDAPPVSPPSATPDGEPGNEAPGPAGRADDPEETPGPPASIEAPSDVADWVDYHLTQYERANANWLGPMRLVSALSFLCPA